MNPLPQLRVAVMFHRVGPYHAARLRAACPGLDLSTLELSAQGGEHDWEPVEITGVRRLTLFERDSRAASPAELQTHVCGALDRERPAVVAVPGWSEPGALAALEWCGRRAIPAVLMSESSREDAPRTAWREWLKRRVVRRCSAALVGGRRHAAYAAELGLAPASVFQGYDAVDNPYFARRAAEIRAGARTQADRRVAEGLSLPRNFFLACARFVPKKNLAGLLRAFAGYRDLCRQPGPARDPWRLVLVGDGPERPRLERVARDLALDPHVEFAGARSYRQLPVFYALANVFVHPSSTEQWGLVVNEAMASRLPVLVSRQTGCAPDLVREGLNGHLFDAADHHQLARLLFRLSRPGTDLAAMGQAGARLISPWGPQAFAGGLRAAAQHALRVGPTPFGALDAFCLRLLTRANRPIP